MPREATTAQEASTPSPSPLSLPKTRNRGSSSSSARRSSTQQVNKSPKSAVRVRRSSARLAQEPIMISDDEPMADLITQSNDEPTMPPTPDATTYIGMNLKTPTKTSSKRNASEPSIPSAFQTPPPPPNKSASSPDVTKTPESIQRIMPKKTPTAQELYSKVAAEIRKPPARKTKNDKPEGNNYVCPLVAPLVRETRLLKIGQTVNAVTKRQSSTKNNCKLVLEEAFNPRQRPIRLYRKAEKLIMAELHEIQYRFECTCKVEHQEFFMVPTKIALEVTQRWTDFCEWEPWDNSGTLHPFWAQRLASRGVWREDEDSLDRRAEEWARFINVTTWDYAKFNLPLLAKPLWQRRWQFVCFIQAIYMMYITFPNAWVAVTAWALQFAYMLDSSLENLGLVTNIRRRKATSFQTLPSFENELPPTEGGVLNGELEGRNDANNLSVLGEDEEVSMVMDE